MSSERLGIWALVLAVVFVIAAGAGGYALGHSGGADVQRAKAAGERAGRARAAGQRHRYRVAYAEAKRAGYKQAYRAAYRSAVKPGSGGAGQ